MSDIRVIDRPFFRGEVNKAKQPKKQVSAAVFRPASPNEAVVILPQTEVKVALEQNNDDPSHMKFWIKLSVKSLVRPGLWGHRFIDANTTNLEYLLSRQCEELCNYQCQQYRDQHNPPAVIRAALDGLKDIQKAAEKARRTRGQL